MNIIQRLIPESNTNTRPGIKMDPKYITIHETDNTNAGADAEAHAQLQQRGNDRTASWHLQIDDKECIQSIPFNEIAWAAGDGRNGEGNLTSIHIEMCVNIDGNYAQTVSNTAEVTKDLMLQFNIPIDHVVQHNNWTGKNCPRYLRSGEKGITWNEFVAMVKTKAAESDPVMWDGSELKKGQIGRITILKKINLWKRVGDKLELARLLKPGEVYRVYGYDDQYGGQYNVGAGYYVTNMEGYIRYETPSKAKLARAAKKE
jgi:N-acetylmuramoyl-L-alanine amidase